MPAALAIRGPPTTDTGRQQKKPHRHTTNPAGTSNSLSDDKQGLRLQGPTENAQTGGQSVHTLADVPLFGSGPGSELIRPFMDNVDLHFLMAKALGLGARTAIMPPTSGAGVTAVGDVTCDAVVSTAQAMAWPAGHGTGRGRPCARRAVVIPRPTAHD